MLSIIACSRKEQEGKKGDAQWGRLGLGALSVLLLRQTKVNTRKRKR